MVSQELSLTENQATDHVKTATTPKIHQQSTARKK